MNTSQTTRIFEHIETFAAWLLALLWIAPLLYACWAGFHSSAYTSNFDLIAPLTFENFVKAWNLAPFGRYFINTFLMVTGILIGQFVLCTLAAYAFARYRFIGREFVFMLVLLQLMVKPEILIVQNYSTISQLGLIDTITGIALPDVASAFGIFLLRQTFKTIPKELEEAARIEGCGVLRTLWKVYIPLARPTYLAYGLVTVSYHWNTFLWPVIVSNSLQSRPLTVGLQLFASPETGVDWSILSAGTLISIAPLILAFFLFQRQFVQSFLRAGVK